MNIIFDAQAFSFQDYGGISRYFAQLKKEFDFRNDINAELIVRISNNKYLTDFNDINIKTFSPSFRFKGRNVIIDMLNQLYLKRKIKSFSAPYIFHPTYYDPYYLAYIRNNPTVLTIHDMTHERFPHTFSKHDKTIINKKITAHKADRIIAISQSTKEDVVRFLNIDEKKIDVIYHANSLPTITSDKFQLSLPSNYILYVGQRYIYKNFSIILKVVSRIFKNYPDLKVICAGGSKLSKKELQLISNLNLNENVIQMNVSDAILAELYSRATAFIFPSLYEGFGIPVLEAFACGCPALLSNTSSLPEIGGDAALYFQPESESELEKQLLSILEDKDLRNTLREKGYQREKLFSWKKTADQTIKCYQKVISL
jgi:glycosyltransferase involved in cell wall biosynthesis